MARDAVAAVERVVERAFPDATPTVIAPFDGGETHDVARVDFADRDPVVVKVTDDGTDRLRRDRAALAYVGRETAVPVPEVLAVDEDPTAAVVEPVPGETTPQLRDFAADDATPYLRAAGEVLARLHRDAGFPAAGRLEGTGDGRLRREAAQSWPALYAALKRDTAAELTGTRFESVATEAADALPAATADLDVDRPALIHCDFGPNNVFRDGATATGVVDWEWCLAGDPAYDLARAERLFRDPEGEGTREALLAGYRAVRPVPGDYDRRRAVYDAYETLSAMSSFASWAPEDPERRRELADRLRSAVADGLP